MKFIPWLIFIGIMLLSFPVYANDALSMLLGRSLEAFIVGTIWVFVVELGYCIYKFNHTSHLRNIIFVIIANAITTIMGVFLMLLTTLPVLSLTFSRVMLRFLLCYACTVPIEALILKLMLRNTEQLDFLDAFMNAALFNLVSYIGIIAIFFILPSRPMG